MPVSTRRPSLRPALPSFLLVAMLVVLVALTTLPARLRAARTERADAGSVTLEQVAIAAGLLAVAVAAVAVIGKAVTNYTDLL